MEADDILFDIDSLRMLAGETVYAAGETYHREGRVRLLALAAQRVLAQVAGTEDYRVELTREGGEIDGACSCPAFGKWGFCKHMVATALSANSAAANRDAIGPDPFSRIRDHLKAKGADALAAMILALAERDPVLFLKLDTAAKAANADDKTIEAQMRGAIDDATRIRDFIEYHEASGWAAGVDGALDAVAELASGPHAASVLRLAAHAIDRIEKAIERIDDSDGHCGALLGRARDIHHEAAGVARPDPVELAHELFNREMGDEYGVFDGAGALYAEVLGTEGCREYRRLAEEAWSRLPPRRPRPGVDYEFVSDYHRLLRILDGFAERDGDVEARIALRAKDLSTPWLYLQLAEFCLSRGRGDEALRWAEEGLWMFEDGGIDRRLVLFVVDRLLSADRKSDAEARLWSAFEKAPDFELYQRLRAFGGANSRDRALTFLEREMARRRSTPSSGSADLLLRILIAEEAFDDAWATLRRHGASAELKTRLARASERTHPRQALEAHAERVDALVNFGGNRAYEEAAGLVGRMAALRGPQAQWDYLAALKSRFARRRNFMKLLP